MPTPEINQAYRSSMPDSSEQAKNLTTFMDGMKDIGNPDPAPAEVVPEPKPEDNPPPEVDPVPAQPEPEPTRIETPLGNIDSPGKKVDAVVPKSEATPEPDVSDEDLAKLFPKKDRDARQEFIRMRKDIKAKEVQLKELEGLRSEVEQLRTKKPEMKLEEIPEYQTAQNELKLAREALEAKEQALHEAQKVVAIADFKKTPEYQQAVIEPWEKKLGPAIAEMAKEKGIESNILFSLVQSKDTSVRKQRFNELVQNSELDQFDQQTVIGFIRDYDSIMDRHNTLEQNAIKLGEMTETQRKAQSEEGYKQYKGVVKKSLDDYRPKLESTWFPNAKNDPDLQMAIGKANEIVDSADWWQIPPEKHAAILETAIKAPILHMMYEAKYKKDMEDKTKEIDELTQKLKTAEDTVKKLSKSAPQAGGRGPTEKPESTKIESKDKFSIGDSIAALT